MLSLLLTFLPFIDSFNGPLRTCSSANDKFSKRVFLLGPSHHLYLEGNLPIDAATTAELHKTGQFDWMTQDVDEDEHSLEMHLPYIYKMLSK
jgi:predicted class III extradiol MEMO1 family dioxygenase